MKRSWLAVLVACGLAWCSTGCAVSYHTNGFTFAVKDKTAVRTLFEVKLGKAELDVKGDPAGAAITIAEEVVELSSVFTLLGF